MRVFARILLIFLAFSNGVAAQGLTNGIAQQPTITLQPAYPSPGDTVTATFEDYRGATMGASLQWIYDGNAIPDANNQRTVTFTAPRVGETATIKVLLDLGGRQEVYQATIQPKYLDLIIEPQTHVPEFYLGRPLPSVGSQVKVTALLSNGSSLGTDYIYLWRINDTAYGGGPLRGASSIMFTMPQGLSAVLSLQVSTPAGVVIAKRTISIPSRKPELLFYEVNTLYGLESQAINQNFNLIANTAIVRAEPYYLDSRVFNYPDLVDWSINNRKVENESSNPYEITLERTGDPGDATVSFHVRSLSQLLQGVERSININI